MKPKKITQFLQKKLTIGENVIIAAMIILERLSQNFGVNSKIGSDIAKAL